MRLLTALFLALTTPALAQPVSLELVLLADSTGSIDNNEINFQRQGYAAGITHPEVIDAITFSGTGKIAVTYVEWGDQNSQVVIAPWTIIAGKQDAEKFAATILAETTRRARGRNAIGAALLFGRDLILNNDIDGARRVIDMSSDSVNNYNGAWIADARDQIIADGITINGLPILCRVCVQPAEAGRRLERRYQEEVIGGHGAFVVTVTNMADFASAVRRKLVLEISGTTPPRRTAAN